MTLLRAISSGIFLVFFAAAAPRAEPLPEPTVEYSADSVTRSDGMLLHARVNRVANKERREVSVNGEREILIVRLDMGLSWLLMPAKREYVEIPLGSAAGGVLSAYDAQRIALGKEAVAGLDTTKYKVVLTSQAGDRFEGLLWMSDRGIVAKLDGDAGRGGVSKHLSSELNNVQVGKQDPALFEIPAGYSKMDVRGFGGK